MTRYAMKTKGKLMSWTDYGKRVVDVFYRLMNLEAFEAKIWSVRINLRS